MQDSFAAVTERVGRFAREREWGLFHDPKNLVMALASEVGELAAEYRWVSNSDADAHSRLEPARSRIAREVGDVGILLLLFCERTGIALQDAIEAKVRLNEAKYPVELTKGRANPPGPLANDP